MLLLYTWCIFCQENFNKCISMKIYITIYTCAHFCRDSAYTFIAILLIMIFRKKNCGAVEMVQSVKCLLEKHKDLRSYLQSPCKKPGMGHP